MPGIDWGAQSRGMTSLEKVFDSIKTQKRLDVEEERHKRLTDLQIRTGEFTLGKQQEEYERTKKNRDRLADIMGKTNKTPETTSIQNVMNQEPGAEPFTTPQQVTTPAVPYTPQEKMQMASGELMRQGDVAGATHAQTMDIQLSAEQRAQTKQINDAIHEAYTMAGGDLNTMYYVLEKQYDLRPNLFPGIKREDIRRIAGVLPDGSTRMRTTPGGAEYVMDLKGDMHFAPKPDMALLKGPGGEPVYGPKVTGAKGYEKPREVERTVDYGDFVRTYFTDGTIKDEKKGKSPGTEKTGDPESRRKAFLGTLNQETTTFLKGYSVMGSQSPEVSAAIEGGNPALILAALMQKAKLTPKQQQEIMEGLDKRREIMLDGIRDMGEGENPWKHLERLRKTTSVNKENELASSHVRGSNWKVVMNPDGSAKYVETK